MKKGAKKIRKLYVPAFFLLIAFLLLGGLWLWAGYWVDALQGGYPHTSYDWKTRQVSRIVLEKRPQGWVPIRSLPRHVVGAILVNEDDSFFQHSGVDTKQLKEAVKAYWKKRRYVRGASTITQQLAKNVFLSNDKTLKRKFFELLLALQLERKFSKRKILELYVNVVEFGTGVYGIGKASWHYFQKPSSSLRPKESAFLAMLLPNPRRHSESFRSKELSSYASKRISMTLKRLQRSGYINEAEWEWEMATPLSFEKDNEPTEFLPDTTILDEEEGEMESGDMEELIEALEKEEVSL